MKSFLIFLLIISTHSYAQIWEEPFDTVGYWGYHTDAPLNNLDIHSYTVTDKFTDSTHYVSKKYLEFNTNGKLIKEVEHYYSFDADTMYYFYNEQGDLEEMTRGTQKRKGIRKLRIKDSLNRTTAIRVIEPDSTLWTTTSHYYYNKSGQLDMIAYNNDHVTLFDYDDNGVLQKKTKTNPDGVYRYYNFYNISDRTLTYTSCNEITVYNETIIACDSVIGTKNKRGDLIRIESYFYMDSEPHITKFEYDRKGRITKVLYVENSGTASSTYFRSKHGLVTRIEHRNNEGILFRHADFKYEFRE